MYNFFTKNVNKKAFIKALKEVEKEGYYVDLSSNDDVSFTTNMSRAVASLSGEEAKKPYVQDKALDISEFTPNLDNERVKPADPTSLGDNQQFVKQTRSQFYEKLFADDDSLLDGSKVQERGLLSNETDSLSSYFGAKQSANSTQTSSISREELVRRTKAKLAELNASARERAELNEQKAAMLEKMRAEREAAIAKAEEEVRAEANRKEQERLAEQARLEAQRIEEEKAKEEEEKTKIKVEVIAPTPQPVPVKEAAKPAKKTTRKPRTTKKKRRYDADIAGGFNF